MLIFQTLWSILIIMTVKNDTTNSSQDTGNMEIVEWGPMYVTGIELIDVQHKELVKLTNVLYQACMTRDKFLPVAFKEAMSGMVEYVRFHFSAENELLERIKYPDYHDHKKQHETLVRNILEAAKSYDEGNKFIPNNFVRSLRDWVFGHIAISDKNYSAYVSEQKKKGLLTDKDIEG